MSYTFEGLLPADFEDLARDLVGADLGVRFEAFAAGPDSGMDGRHASDGQDTILQVKHYASSSFSVLKRAVVRERVAIDRLCPDRYVLATSRRLTPGNKATLALEIGPALETESHIYGPDDLNALLRRFPQIEKSHIKLWLSGGAALDRIIRSAAYAYTAITHDEIKAKVRAYALNPSFAEARAVLEGQHLLIISGPPGVGKTTLAEMLSYAYISDGWELVAIRNLDDGLAAIDDGRRQMFLFDDFLGTIALDARSLSTRDSDLARFFRRIRKSPNARFILTTRAYIFEEARRVSEHLADQRLEISKYVLDVGLYTRRIRARILYNHLLVAGTPGPHVNALVRSGQIARIIDHRNYNPRVIEWMTDAEHLTEIAPEDYPKAFLGALANPRRLWDTAYRTHIPYKCQHLLIAIFFSRDTGTDVEDLRRAYDALHERLCFRYGRTRSPKDFEEALRILEGGFITIRDRAVNFVNPSFRDYMDDYLADGQLLTECALSATTADAAGKVWRLGLRCGLSPEQEQAFAACFLDIARNFNDLPVWRRINEHPIQYRMADMALAARLSLLLEWWSKTQINEFAQVALTLAETNALTGFSSWLDGNDLVSLIRRLRGGEIAAFPSTNLLCDYLEAGLLAVIASTPVDILTGLSESLQDHIDVLPDATMEAVWDNVRSEVRHIGSELGGMDSTSTLNDKLIALKHLAPKAGIAEDDLDYAISRIEDRIAELMDLSPEADGPDLGTIRPDDEAFDDEALRDLFMPLAADRMPLEAHGLSSSM